MIGQRILASMGRQIGRTLSRRSLADAAPAREGMAFTLASPSEMYYHNADVKQVDVPSYSGDFGILAYHVPCLAVLKPGVVTVYPKDGDLKRYFVSSGTITINEDSTVQVLAEQAVPVDRLDSGLVQDGLQKAQQQLASAGDEGAKMEAQILVEVHEAMQKAVIGL
ncbi:ATP synthase subunit delta, mitochondrial-like [Varroa jacobsoni]|uniref:ATP synthase F(1) complex subunit delta, mitochondrial n=1 Tax=Varroa destructor TaxID=109461 RepID=A0A7M7M5S1_VARDE|nr:ATP synthase subunit delta, mitochondrial-like [Varroa destructor]XP_022705240.1 ATP synthase subunit delta, mitochondrial-like [Varroa jacobsoni]